MGIWRWSLNSKGLADWDVRVNKIGKTRLARVASHNYNLREIQPHESWFGQSLDGIGNIFPQQKFSWLENKWSIFWWFSFLISKNKYK